MLLPKDLAQQKHRLRFGLDFCDWFAANGKPIEVWDELTFRQCAGICMVTFNKVIRLAAFRRMRKVGTFNDWRNELFAPLRNHPKLILTALSMMHRLATKNHKDNQTVRLIKDGLVITMMIKPIQNIIDTAKRHRPIDPPCPLTRAFYLTKLPTLPNLKTIGLQLGDSSVGHHPELGKISIANAIEDFASLHLSQTP